MIKAVVVDDEDKSRDTLLALLDKYCPQVRVVATAVNVAEGINAISNHQPDLVFLDVEMPDGTGFDLLEQLSPVAFEIIFTTAFNQYAIRAIRSSALDFLLKPVVSEDLITAVSRFELKKQSHNSNDQIKVLLSNIKELKGALHKIAIPASDGLVLLDINDIVRLEADGSYTRFITMHGNHLISRTMKEYDDMLSGNNFLRVHHGHLINIHHVKKYVRGEGGYLVMVDGTSVPVSVRKKAEVVEKLSMF
jgi:two-component system LytT family response regulator